MTQQSSILFFTLYLAFTPIIFWLWFSYYKKEQEKFSPAFMVSLIALGALAVAPAGGLEYVAFKYLPQDLTSCYFTTCDLLAGNVVRLFVLSFALVALVEEGAKYVFLWLIVKRSGKFTRLIDGVRYGALFGMGFAGLENGIYLFQSFSNQDFNQLFTIFILRFLISSVGHAMYGSIMGYFLFKYKFGTLKRRAQLVKAFVIPLALHGLFDFFLLTQTGFYTVFLVAAALVALVYIIGDPRAKETFVLDPASKKLDVKPAPDFVVSKEKSKKVETLLYTCPLCHNKNILEAKFCAQCGYALD